MAVQIFTSLPPSSTTSVNGSIPSRKRSLPTKSTLSSTPKKSKAVRGSRLDVLPNEILTKIFEYVNFPQHPGLSTDVMPVTPNSIVPPQYTSLLPCTCTSRNLYITAVPVLYRHPATDTKSSFIRLKEAIQKQPRLGVHIRSLDLTSSLVRTHGNTKQAIDSESIAELLRHTPLLRQISIGNESLGAEVNFNLWQRIFDDLEHVERVSLVACPQQEQWPLEELGNKTRQIPLKHLKITNLPIDGLLLQSLLSRSQYLKSLDLSGILIRASSLKSLPATARLEHVALQGCLNFADGAEVVAIIQFFANHPSITHSLTSLELEYFSESGSCGFSHENVTHLLQNLPRRSMKSLRLRGFPVDGNNLNLLRDLENLERLSLGSLYSVRDLERLILGATYTYPPSDLILEPSQFNLDFKGSMLSTLYKAMFVTKLRARLNSITRDSGAKTQSNSRIKHLDLSDLSLINSVSIIESVLLAEETRPLQVIEINDRVLLWKDGLVRDVVESVGWRTKSVAKRTWIERI